MSEQVKYTEKFEELPLIAKVLLFLPWTGGLVSGVYRILRYLETKNTTTLVVGILCFLCLGVVVGIIDLITDITNVRVTVLAE